MSSTLITLHHNKPKIKKNIFLLRNVKNISKKQRQNNYQMILFKGT